MSEIDQNLDPKVVIGHCDLISWFIAFALLYLDTKLIYMNMLLSDYGLI